MSIQPCNCYTSDPKPPYFKDDNYYCATCDKGMGNAYFAAASDRDRALADLAKERERAEDVFKDNVRLCAEKTRVWVENAALRAELAECRAELESWEKEAEANDLFTRHPNADAMMREALGQELFDRWWGPGLEALGKCVDVALNRAKAAEARAERAEELLRKFRNYGWVGKANRALIDAALAETAQEASASSEASDAKPTRPAVEVEEPGTSSRGIPRTNDDGERRGNIHPEPGTSSPDDAIRELTQEAQRLGMYDDDAGRAALAWMNEHCSSEGGEFTRFGRSNMTLENACDDGCDCLPTLAALLRTRDAQAREAARVEMIEDAIAGFKSKAEAGYDVPPYVFAELTNALDHLKRPDRAKGERCDGCDGAGGFVTAQGSMLCRICGGSGTRPDRAKGGGK